MFLNKKKSHYYFIFLFLFLITSEFFIPYIFLGEIIIRNIGDFLDSNFLSTKIISDFYFTNKNSPKLCQLPFDQNLKRKSVIRQIPGDPENVRVYVKGAPEYIF